MPIHPLRYWAILLCAHFAAAASYASIGLVAGEPFGSFGTMLPVGHAAVYLDHICAATPTRLRPCLPGEHGVILSRYHDLYTANLDWLATPVIPFLYGVENIADVPAFVTPTFESTLRESYREAHLTTEAPSYTDRHGNVRPPKYGDWDEAIGAAFDRRILLYVIDTTPEQDLHLMTLLNTQANHRRYTFRRRNCADFAADLLSMVFPIPIRRNVPGDFDIMTPKQIARTMDTYGQAHPEINLHVYEVPQIPGTLRRSRPIRGAAEGLLKTRRYLATLIVIQPEAVLIDWIDYEKNDKWTPGLDAVTVRPSDWLKLDAANGNSELELEPLAPPYSPASTSSSTASDGIGLRAK